MEKNQAHFTNNIIPGIKKCDWYFGGLMIILSASALLLLLTGKAKSFIFLNSYHPFLLNVFFINYTSSATAYLHPVSFFFSFTGKENNRPLHCLYPS
ncbi:MAG: hypothetical protein WDO19_10605 [Bacteroidota bacterium]